MLRVLRCDPGMIDGTPGEVTTAAVQVFQEEYRDGVFHRHIEEVDPALPTLKVDGILGTQTRAALIEAYALACSPRVPPEQLHPSHPIVGCTEFNQLEDPETPPHMNRRVTLVTHDALPPFHDNAPCTMGDHNACPVTDTGPLRCPWYRLHVEDADPNEVGQLHFDLRWLQLPNGKILLSALTTLDDDTPVSFEVFRSKPVAGPEEIDDNDLGDPLSEVLSGIVRLGVAQAVWDPPEGFELLDIDSWLVPVQHSTAYEIWSSPRKRRPPLFRVSGAGVSVTSPPPGDDFGRVISRYTKSQAKGARFVMGVDAFGNHHQHEIDENRPKLSYSALLADETRVVAVRFVDAHLERTES